MNEDHGDEWFRLDELSSRLAGLVWVEEQLFELLGRWAVTESHPQAKIVFASASRHHGWHAQVLRECLATSDQLLETSAPHPPTEGWQAAVESLRELTDGEATVARLLSLVREINPWLVRETGVYLDLARPVSDAPLMRWLRFVELDHHEDGLHLAQLLETLRSNTVSFADHALLSDLDLT